MSAEVLAPSSAAQAAAGARAGADRSPLAGLTVWRLLVAASGFLGVWLAALQYPVWWTALSQLASLAVGASYLWFAAHPFVSRTRAPEPSSPWLRGALATLMLLVSLAYLAMTGGDLSDPYSPFEHLVTPTLVVLDFVLVGRNQAAVKAWHPLTWLLPPTAYLVYYVLGDLRVYVALDPGQPGPFAMRTAALLALVLVCGHLLYAVGQARCPKPTGPDWLDEAHDRAHSSHR